MADNNDKNNLGQGTRVRIIDPNNFDRLYQNDVFGLKPLNTSVPTEDLCIIVELTTKTKNRTILNTSNNKNSKIQKNGDTISFIDGTKNSTTGNENYLTTQYTELNTEIDSLGESLGITNIDIDFNSSYAPMININFIDIKGGAIFQPGGESKYAVFFKLPYPLFELKVKGFYGKPVTYCLHLIKCNTKFNSQSGNFEISAQFVGYTYAMLSDMIIGYLKGAAQMEEGKKILETKKLTIKNGGESSMISINDFIREITNIDSLITNQLKTEDKNVNDLGIITEMESTITDIKNIVNNTINAIKNAIVIETSNDENILILKDTNPNPNLDTIVFSRQYSALVEAFKNDYTKAITNFNSKSNFSDLKLNTNLTEPSSEVYSVNIVKDRNKFIKYEFTQYKNVYDITDQNNLNLIIDRLQNAASQLEASDRLIKFVDFTDILEDLDNVNKNLSIQKSETVKLVAESLRDTLVSNLGFDPTIRNTITMLTSHVEMFLELLYKYSARFTETDRLKELEKFKTNENSKTSSIDVHNDIKKGKDGIIYPWPEYIENGEEKYLGSKTGPLKNPLNVPEIEFVEKLYEGMVMTSKLEENLNSNGVNPWKAISPIDSIYYNKKSPYDRLDDSAVPNDVVRLVMLRAIGFLAFSNKNLIKDEIEAFAESEANLVLNKFDSKQSVLSAIDGFQLDAFTGITGTIDGKNIPVVTSGSFNNYNYNYIKYFINGLNTDYLLPINDGFNNVMYLENRFSDLNNILSINYCYIVDKKGSYIDFINSDDYDKSTPIEDKPLVFDELKGDTINIQSAGFLANNGNFGVQQCKSITYPDSDIGTIPFYSLFYETDEEYFIIGDKRENSYFDLNKSNFLAVYLSKKSGSLAKREVILQPNNLPDSINPPNENIKSFKTNKEALRYPFFGQDMFVGSRFYNYQKNIGKAFLFLNYFPFKKLNNKPILNTFKYRTGFIQVPRLWPAFIGSLLYRLEQSNDIITFKIENEFLYPTDTIPSKNKYVDDYQPLEDELIKLPEFIKKKFIEEFNKFVKDEFPTIKKSFEVIPKNAPPDYDLDEKQADRDDLWKKTWEIINSKIKYNTFKPIGVYQRVSNTLETIETYLETTNGTKLTDRYVVFSHFAKPSDDFNYGLKTYDDYNYIYITEFKQNGDADNKLKELFFSYKYIANNIPNVWGNDNQNNCALQPSAGANELKTYIDKFKTIIKNKIVETQKVLATNNDNDQIKLEIYRTLKKIYDKWIADTSQGSDSTISNDILFQCCKLKTGKQKGRLETDDKLKNKRGGTDLGLIDSFRFLTRSFKDIGDDFQINPTMVCKILLTSGNNSFYDVVSRILTDNKFEFIALPNFINYNEQKELEQIFTPYPYYEVVDETTTGPTFICMYVGQTSTKLDFGKKSLYPDDGFNFTEVDDKGKLIDSPQKPDDFSETPKEYEDIGVAFIVKYGQQNQNIFKDVSLDQAEFNETAESINITDAIANRFSQASQTYVGQNLYNIYSIRSYKVEIEMMGDAMIQPMMYFQLDNIPMFRGAYLITKVKHSIKPNYMSTTFTGTRINKNQTPLIDVSSLFSSMLNGYDIPLPNQGAQLLGNSYVGKYVSILKNNLPSDKKIENNPPTNYPISDPVKTKITKLAEDELKVWKNGQILETDDEGKKAIDRYWGILKPKNGNTPQHTVNDPWSAVFISYIMKTADINFPASAKHYDYVSNAMDGANGYEVFPLNESQLQIKAEVGDILISRRTGGYTASHSDLVYKIDGNKAYLIGGNRSILNGDPNKGVTLRSSTLDLEQLPSANSGDYTNNIASHELVMKKTNARYYKKKILSTLYSDTYNSNGKNVISPNTIYSSLISAGISRNLAIGIIGNMYIESEGLDLNAFGDGKFQSPYTEINEKTNVRLTRYPLKVPDNFKIGKPNSRPFACSWGLTQLNVCGGLGEEFLTYNKIPDNESHDNKIAALTDYDLHIKFVIKKVKELFSNTYNNQGLTIEYWTTEFAKKYEGCSKCNDLNSTTMKNRLASANKYAKIL